MTTPSSNSLDLIFQRLTSKSEDIRLAAAHDLRDQVKAYTQEYPGQDGIKGVWGDVFRRTFELTRSTSGNERLGAIAAIGKSIR